MLSEPMHLHIFKSHLTFNSKVTAAIMNRIDSNQWARRLLKSKRAAQARERSSCQTLGHLLSISVHWKDVVQNQVVSPWQNYANLWLLRRKHIATVLASRRGWQQNCPPPRPKLSKTGYLIAATTTFKIGYFVTISKRKAQYFSLALPHLQCIWKQIKSCKISHFYLFLLANINKLPKLKSTGHFLPDNHLNNGSSINHLLARL